MTRKKKFTILNVFDLTIYYFLKFCKTWKVWSLYILVLTFLSALSGSWSHTCKDELFMSWWCGSIGSIYSAYTRMVIYFLAVFFLSFAFCYDIYKGNAMFGSLFSITKKKLRFMGFAVGLCAIFFSSLAIAVWLIFRKANPDWFVEFGFFLIVFTLSTLAVLILRTSASLGVFLQTDKMPDFKQLFNLTHAKFYVVLITFCVVTYAVNILQMNVMRSLELWNMQKVSFYVAIMSEFLSSAFKFLVLAVYTAYFLALANCLLPENFTRDEKQEQKELKTLIKNSSKKKMQENTSEISKKNKEKREKNARKYSKKMSKNKSKTKNKGK